MESVDCCMEMITLAEYSSPSLVFERGLHAATKKIKNRDNEGIKNRGK
jgi:hypothetical protein